MMNVPVKNQMLKERLLVTIFVCPSVLWLTFFLSHFRYNIIHLLIIIITLFLLSTTTILRV